MSKPNEEDGMDKYGVDQSADETLEKRANRGCPVDGCGRTPMKHGSVLLCPQHGSEPFEGS